MAEPHIEIYTDGSCHTQLLIGAWAAIIYIDGKKETLSACELNTTHNRMELLAVINAITHIDSLQLAQSKLIIYSDSQYVVNLCDRKEKLKAKKFITNKGTHIQNYDLVQTLIYQMENHNLVFNKIKAHQQNGNPHNREVDLIVRKIVREKTGKYD